MRKQVLYTVSPDEIDTLEDAVDEYVALTAEHHPQVDLVNVRNEVTAFVRWLDKQSPTTTHAAWSPSQHGAVGHTTNGYRSG